MRLSKPITPLNLPCAAPTTSPAAFASIFRSSCAACLSAVRELASTWLLLLWNMRSAVSARLNCRNCWNAKGANWAMLYRGSERKNEMREIKEIPTSPIVGWTIFKVEAHNALRLQFRFLTSPMQKPEEANQSRMYILNQAQAIQLADFLTRNAAELPGQESGIPPFEPCH